ncbi:MAG TPA: UDP-N-acetylmuramate dehydrogenase [Candidatus Paceibacterota bacterium]
MFKRNVLLAPYTTFGIGGRADYFLEVRNPEELVLAVKLAVKDKMRYEVIAGGSNVVFSDKTFDGLVIHYRVKKQGSTLKTRQGRTLKCEAGLLLSRLIETAISNGLAGLETLSGIPGTVGGAIVGNAGAYGQTISDCLTRVEIFDPKNVRHSVSHKRWLTKKQCRFAYRESVFKSKNWLILRAEFKLKKGDKKVLAKKSREIIKVRSEKYNPNLRCPGSFFKNVLISDVSRVTLARIDKQKIRAGKIPAGYLLEAVGAKGRRVGGIYVADFHGNLLINDGHGTYRDVRLLAAKLKKLVQKKFGIELDEEVRYIN